MGVMGHNKESCLLRQTLQEMGMGHGLRGAQVLTEGEGTGVGGTGSERRVVEMGSESGVGVLTAGTKGVGSKRLGWKEALQVWR